MSDRGSLAVHETRSAIHFAAVDGTEALMSKADAEYGNFAREMFDGFGGNAAIFDGFAWTWRDDEMVRLEGDQLVQGNLVIAKDANIRAEFAEVLDEVVGEGVVVIYKG
jgi:hypothetical protein